MVEDLTTLWKNFSLPEEEGVEVEIKEKVLVGIVTRGKSYLIGKLTSERMINKDTIRSTLIRGWRPSGALFQGVGN
jgi:hypothetical protein